MNRRLFDVQYIPAGILFAVLVALYFSFMKLFLFEAESVICPESRWADGFSPVLGFHRVYVPASRNCVLADISNAADFIGVHG